MTSHLSKYGLMPGTHPITGEEIYTRAEEFIPERWYLYPDMVKEKSAFAPFSIGE